MDIKTIEDFEGHIMNQLTKTLEGLDNLLELGLISPKEYAENAKKARLLFEKRYSVWKHQFQETSSVKASLTQKIKFFANRFIKSYFFV